jgi:hypothetical protein
MAIVLSSPVFSQELIQYPVGTLKLVIQQYGGSNGTAVVFNPEEQFYYTVFAGNADYPLETFTRFGNNIYQANAGNDIRGMWWNPKAKALEANCYDDGGIISIGLTEEGYAGTSNTVIFDGADYQPNEHAVGVFDPVKKEILYYSDGFVMGYSRKSGKPTKTFIFLLLPVEVSDMNWSTLIYTGVKGMELGLLDYASKKVYLFDRSSGLQTGTVELPKTAVTYDRFNFSYANGNIFLFDQDERTWTGYRIF